MKTTKKIFAALLAVMMIALMIPFSASAAETNTLTLNAKTGYTFTLYKVADVDTTTGEYKNITTGLESILTTKATEGVDSAALLTACNTLSLTGGTDYTYATGDALTKTIYNLADGVYYLKVKSAPEGVNVTSVTNSVFALPYYTGSEWVNEVTVNAAEKITDGTPTVSKKFTNNATASSISEFIGKDVSFTLTGSVVGSTTEKAKSYQFVDTMSAGLTYKALTSVNLVKANGTKTDITSSVTYYAKTGTTDNSFTLTIDPTVLANDDFYSNVSVEAVYTATVNTNAVIGGAGNPNKVDLSYTNSYNQTSKIEGNEVKVFTFDLTVVKVDANNTATKLNGAGFTLYTDLACTSVATNGSEKVTSGTEVVDGKDVDKGIATFTGIKAGTYYLKETTAPAGYNINSTVYKVNISDNGTVTNANGETITQVEVGDTPLLTPNTGGMGTMMFTIGGAALIACAGVLFLIVRKKKAAK